MRAIPTVLASCAPLALVVLTACSGGGFSSEATGTVTVATVCPAVGPPPGSSRRTVRSPE